jgi:hypothetical protein
MKPALLRGILPGQETRVADFMQGKNAAALAALKPGAFQIVLGRNWPRRCTSKPATTWCWPSRRSKPR